MVLSKSKLPNKSLLFLFGWHRRQLCVFFALLLGKVKVSCERRLWRSRRSTSVIVFQSWIRTLSIKLQKSNKKGFFLKKNVNNWICNCECSPVPIRRKDRQKVDVAAEAQLGREHRRYFCREPNDAHPTRHAHILLVWQPFLFFREKKVSSIKTNKHDNKCEHVKLER